MSWLEPADTQAETYNNVQLGSRIVSILKFDIYFQHFVAKFKHCTAFRSEVGSYLNTDQNKHVR